MRGQYTYPLLTDAQRAALKGDKGDRGPAGAQGPQGDVGAKGSKGDTGDRGLAGQQGVAGAIGPAGAKGENGAAGATGSQGPKGDVGATGAVGPQGVAGPKGDTGSQGPQGVTGSQGAIGAKGDTGIPGYTLVGQVSLIQSAQLLAIQAGIKDLTVDCAGTVAGERYQPFIRKYKLNGAASYTNGKPPNYSVVDAGCAVAGKITVSHNTPAIALLGGQYELVVDIVKVNAA